MKGTIIVQNTTRNFDIIQNSNIKVYPNPSTGLVHVAMGDLKSFKGVNFQVFNLYGEIEYGAAVKSSIFDIDLNNVPSGIYFLNIFEGQKFLIKRIVKL
jgi:hypothetical protein